jgi:hypothetical protein
LKFISAYFADDITSCAISKIQEESEVFAYLDDDFLNNLKSISKSENIQKAQFLLNGIKTVQYRIIGNEIINFKLFLKIDTVFYQVDYLIPKNSYNQEIKVIESCIGSIIKIKNQKNWEIR